MQVRIGKILDRVKDVSETEMPTDYHAVHRTSSNGICLTYCDFAVLAVNMNYGYEFKKLS